MQNGIYNETLNGSFSVAENGFCVRNCVIDGDLTLKDTKNCLVAQSKINGSIYVENCSDCVILLCDTFELYAKNCNNLFVIGNNASGGMTFTENAHLIADGNAFAYVMDVDNIGVNGDSVTDIYERAECGALRRLQPHTDKDLFVGEERVELIDDLPFGEYLRSKAESNDVVIIPPGVYSVDKTIYLEAAHSNTEIYAYGACVEMTEYSPIFEIKGIENVNVYGLTVSYSSQPCGQIHVLDQIDERTLTVVCAAGMDEDFGKTDPSRFHTGFTDVFRAGSPYPWGNIGSGYELFKNGDGTMTMILQNLVGEIHPGDAVACRLAGHNKHTIRIIDSKNVHFTDLVTYGYAAALAVVGGGTDEDISLTRWHNTNRSAPIIDREDYFRYKYLEEQYGVDLGVYVDKLGRYRGTAPLVGSVDATHVTGARRGFDLTSCLFESMVDDGSNQRSSSSRLAAVKDNGDGTTTLTIKGYLSEIYYKMNAWLSNCASFDEGDRIFIYTSKGIPVCDTVTISASEIVGDHEFTILNTKGEPKTYTSKYREVKVKTSDVNFEALEGYDLTDDSYEMTHKVIVDNISRNSCNFTIDNVTVQNTRSRGVLFKSSGVTVMNSTFKNLAHTGLYLSTEKEWGESTICRDITIQNCILDHVGFFNNYDWLTFLSPISIVGFASKVSRDTLVCQNILIAGNRFLNNNNDYQLSITAAQNVRIKNNLFAPGLCENQTKPRRVFHIESSMDIEISDNTYSHYLNGDIEKAIVSHNSENIFGSDITPKE